MSLFQRDPDRRIRRNIRKFRRTALAAGLSAQRSDDWQSRIEVVIPCFNQGAYAADAFASIVEQTLRLPLTVSLVNDASEDDSLQLLHEIEASSREIGWITIRVLDNPTNLNQGGSINRAVATASNDLFVILNADDLLVPDCLEIIVHTYEQESDLFMLGGGCIPFSSSPPPQHQPRPLGELALHKYGPDDAVEFDQLNSLNLTQSSCSFFKGAWGTVGGYWPRGRRVCSYDDRDFQMRVCALFPVGVYPDYPLAFYRTTSSVGRALL